MIEHIPAYFQKQHDSQYHRSDRLAQADLSGFIVHDPVLLKKGVNIPAHQILRGHCITHFIQDLHFCILIQRVRDYRFFHPAPLS